MDSKREFYITVSPKLNMDITDDVVGKDFNLIGFTIRKEE